LKEEPINPSYNRTVVTPVMFVFGVARLNLFQNIEKKKRASVELSIAKRWRESLPRKESLFLPARKPVPFNKIQKAMWLWWPKGNSKKLWN